MMNWIGRFCFFGKTVATGLLLVLVAVSAGYGQPLSLDSSEMPGTNDSDLVYVAPGVIHVSADLPQTFTMAIVLHNHTVAGAITLPLTFAGLNSSLKIDTTIHDADGNVGVTHGPLGRNPAWSIRSTLVDNDLQTILIGYISFGDGLPLSYDTLVYIHFRTEQPSPPVIHQLDTLTLPPSNQFTITTPDAEEVTPQWRSGEIAFGDFSTLRLNRTRVFFSAEHKQRTPPSQRLYITGCNQQRDCWTANSSVSWASGFHNETDFSDGSITVIIRSTSLEPGTHYGEIAVTPNEYVGEPLIMQVFYTVTEPVEPFLESDSDHVSIVPPFTTFLADTGGAFSVSVILNNRTSAEAITLPLTFRGMSPNLRIDTSIHDGAGNLGITHGPLGRSSAWTLKTAQVNNDFQSILLGYIAFGNGLQPSHDTLVTIHFRVDPDDVGGAHLLDTTALPPANHISVVGPGAIELMPTFERGVIALGRDDYLCLSTNELLFEGWQGGSIPDPQVVQTISCNGGPISWTAMRYDIHAILDAPGKTADSTGLIVGMRKRPGDPGLVAARVLVTALSAKNSPLPIEVYYRSYPLRPLSVSPERLDFSAFRDSTLPTAQRVVLYGCEGPWEASVSASAGWLDVSSARLADSLIIVTGVNATALAAGVYHDTVVIVSECASNSPIRIPVTYAIVSGPMICVTPDHLTFSAYHNDSLPPPQQMTVFNCGIGSLEYAVSNSASWLEVTSAVGGGDSVIVTATVRTTDLPAGLYHDSIVVKGDSAVNNPVYLPVGYTVRQPSVTDRIYIAPTSLFLTPGQDTTFHITLMADIALDNALAITIPLTFAGSSNHFSIDSSILSADHNIGIRHSTLGNDPSWTLRSSLVDYANRTILIGYLSFTDGLVPPQHDSLVNVYFTFDGSVPGPVVFRIDTTIIPPANHLSIVGPWASETETGWGGLDIRTGIGDETAAIVPGSFQLGNAPNPFNAATEIRFVLSRPGMAELVIFNTLGRRVATLVDGNLPAGPQRVNWHGRSASGSQVGSGLYFYRLTAEGRTETRKMVLLR